MPNFSAERLRIARMRRNLTQKELAEKCGITLQLISLYEKGKQSPSETVMPKLCFALGFAPKFFFADNIEIIPETYFSFRSRRSMKKGSRENAYAMGNIATTIISPDLNVRFKLPDVTVPNLRGHRPEDAADILRAEWRLGAEPIVNLVQLLEAHGAEVYWLEESADLDAVSLWYENKPFVAINGNINAGERVRFSTAHELGHLVLHCGEDDLSLPEREDEANRFASAFVLPATSFGEECPNRPHLPTLYKLKRRWGASVAAQVMRGYDIGIFTDWQKRQAFETLSISGERKVEKEPITPEKSKLHRLILDALKSRGIDFAEYAISLGIDLSTLRELIPFVKDYMVNSTPSNPNDKGRPTYMRIAK